MAKLLSREKQDIILMDDNEEKLSTLNSNFDLMTATASPTSIKGLKEVGVGEADLFIAVTPDESRNMTACMLANYLGAQMMEAAGIPLSDYQNYLLEQKKEMPLISTQHTEAEGSDAWLNYQTLQYYLLFDWDGEK